MTEHEFQLRGDYIQLTSLLKAMNFAATGGHAGLMIEEGEVKVNDIVETRKRKKLQRNDRVQISDELIIIV